MTRLTGMQKICLEVAKKRGIVRIGEYFAEGTFYEKRTIHSLINKGYLAATEYFNQYEITHNGRAKVTKFKKSYVQWA